MNIEETVVIMEVNEAERIQQKYLKYKSSKVNAIPKKQMKDRSKKANER